MFYHEFSISFNCFKGVTATVTSFDLHFRIRIGDKTPAVSFNPPPPHTFSCHILYGQLQQQKGPVQHQFCQSYQELSSTLVEKNWSIQHGPSNKNMCGPLLYVVYFDLLSGAALTRKLVELLFFSRFQPFLFISNLFQ